MVDEAVDFLFELQPATSDDSFNKTIQLAFTLFNIYSKSSNQHFFVFAKILNYHFVNYSM